MCAEIRENAERLLEDTWKAVAPFARDKIPSINLDVTEVSNGEKLDAHPVVSVVVVTYKHEKYIVECLESICSQETTFPFEVLVGDDCSPDSTRDLVLEVQKRYPDRIRLFYSDNNVGLAANNSRLTKMVRGRYVAICEGDDFWCNRNKLQMQVDFLESHPDVALVHGGCYCQYETKTWTKCPTTNRHAKDLLRINEMDLFHQRKELLFRNYIATPTVCMRADAYKKANCEIDEIGLKVRWLTVTDFVTWFLCSRAGKICYMPVYVAVRRINRASLTAIQDENVINARRLADSRISLALSLREGFEENIIQQLADIVSGRRDKLNNTNTTGVLVKRKSKSQLTSCSSPLALLIKRIILLVTKL